MKKETKITIIAGLIAIFIGITVFQNISRILCKKDIDYIYKNGEFIGQPKDEYDVLFLGSSHMGIIQPQYFWENYGISSYNLYCTGDGIIRSKAMLENALEYSAPRLVVLETEKYWDTTDFSDRPGDLNGSFDYFPLTFTKIKTIFKTISDNDARLEMLFPIIKYHDRYSRIKETDFNIPADDSLGATLDFDSEPQSPSARVQKGQRPKKLEKGIEDGLHQISEVVELCKSKGIDIMLVCLPFSAKRHFQENIHLIDDVAEKYDVIFYNFHDHDPIIDFSCDLYDRGHMNVMGSYKVSDVLAGQILDNYDIKDRRGEPGKTERWNNRQASYRQHLFKIADNSHEIDTLNEMLVLMNLPYFCGEVYLKNSDTRILEKEGMKQLIERKAGRELPGINKAIKDNLDYLIIYGRDRDSVREYVGDEIDDIFDGDIPSHKVYITLRDANSEDMRFVADMKL